MKLGDIAKKMGQKLVVILMLFLTGSMQSCVTRQVTNGTSGISFKASTYNIRYDASADKTSGNSWDTRKQALVDLIKRHGFDIIGTQEGMNRQMIELKKMMPGFDYINYPYGGKADYHNSGIVYRTSMFEVMDTGTFWFSETPDIPSIGWDATDRRICLWGKFKHKPSGKEFYYFNVHFYWKLEEARRASGPLLVKKIKEIAKGYPAICVGDFNSEPETSQIKAIKAYLHDSYDLSGNGRKGVENTAFHGGVFHGDPIFRIDYIFVSDSIKVQDYEVYSDIYNQDRYPSDHLPVSCIVTL